MTRSLPETFRKVPAGAKFCPKMERIAFGAATCIAGVLRPALTTPPVKICGEFAAVVSFLASARAAYVTGSIVRVDGGMIRSL